MINQKSHEEKWKNINWTKVERYVFRLQKGIYSASKNKDIKKVSMIRRIIIDSWQAKLLAVRRVTQDNSGKKTPGVDGVKDLAPGERYSLAQQLSIGAKTQPVRRVWIPKPGTSEKRPLGIPTISDRALQALVKIAIEPEWEAVFEPNSYGFRPGRGCHDAIKAILNSIKQKPKYVLDADIAKCFDRINHEALLDMLGYKGRIRQQIKQWLKAGVLDGDQFVDTEMGTPQGGVISPLLANIALHGMENKLKDFIQEIPMKFPNKGYMGSRDKRASLSVIRYADDFVVMHESKEIVLKCKEILQTWLKNMGLELKAEKTRLSHTLLPECSDDGKAGFDFLGFTIKQYKSKYKSAFSSHDTKPLGFKTLIIPSKKSQRKQLDKIAKIISEKKSISIELLIKRLNPIITGWTNYFAISDGFTIGTFDKMDYLLYLKLRKWAKRRIRSRSKALKKFWKRVNDRWEFGNEENTLVMYRDIAKGKSIHKYIKVLDKASPFDGNNRYWASRLGENLYISPSEAKILKKQGGKCTYCGLFFRPDDNIEKDHIIPISKGGNSKYDNLQLLHKHCHDIKTASDLLNTVSKKGKSNDNGPIIE